MRWCCACLCERRISDLVHGTGSIGTTFLVDDQTPLPCGLLQELEEVAKFIRQRGRVSIDELADNSNRCAMMLL